MIERNLCGVEQWREYVFDSGFAYRIELPQTLFISPTGSHRVEDGYGVTHHIANWRVIRWEGEHSF